MKKILFLFAAFVIGLAAVSAEAQRLVRVESNGSLSAKTINDFIKKNKMEGNTPAATAPVSLRKITYISTDENGREVQLNGLLATPQGSAPKGLVAFMHGTIWDRDSSPSKTNSKGGHGESMGAISFYCPAGYAVVLPDYIGLGDNKRVHPYPMNVINAVSGADIIPSARQIMRQANYNVGERLFVSGYSEGGGIAMALAKLLQESGTTAVTASAPMSGPYDLSGATRDYLIREASGKDLIARAYLLGYTIKYFEAIRGIKANEYFTPRMARTVDGAFKDGRSDENIAIRLAIMGTLTGGTRSVEKLLTSRFINALERLDMKDPVIAELSRNNVYDWSPKMPMLLINLSTDRIVDPANSDVAFRTMRRRGVGPNILRRLVFRDDKMDHGTAFPPALIASREFFDNGFSGMKNLEQ